MKYMYHFGDYMMQMVGIAVKEPDSSIPKPSADVVETIQLLVQQLLLRVEDAT
jgi:hypothetical protein